MLQGTIITPLDFKTFAAENIESIDSKRRIFSLYGSNATVSVINIKQKKLTKKHRKANWS